MTQNIKKAKLVYGIDLGTTNSCISYVDEYGKPVVINNKLTNNPTTPSVVLFVNKTKAIVGEIAKDSAILEPSNTFDFVKQKMGTDATFEHHGVIETPESISAIILKRIVDDAASVLDTEVNDVVITCPAYFGTEATEATKMAGIACGLNVLEIIREPNAAAYFYCHDRHEINKSILVYDLGGGTFDVTVVHINSEGIIEEICKDGKHDLGGRLWDQVVLEYLWDTFCDETDYQGDRDKYAEQELKLKAEKLKWLLSESDEATITVSIGRTSRRIGMSLKDFNKLSRHLLEETIDLTDRVIRRTREKGYPIDKILLVGSATRMQQVFEIVQKRYYITPESFDPDLAVCKGAALWAKKIASESRNIPIYHTPKDTIAENEPSAEKPVTIVNTEQTQTPTTPQKNIFRNIITSATKSYALEVLDNSQEPVCYNFIIKDTKLHSDKIEYSKQCYTVVDNQKTATLKVYESDFVEEVFELNTDYLLGEIDLLLPPNTPAKEPIKVTFILNREGILRVIGLHEKSGSHIDAEIRSAKRSTALSIGDLQKDLEIKSITADWG